MKYYRGQYLIAVYATIKEGETLLALCDNITEFAEYMNINKNNAGKILHQLFHQHISFIKKDGKRRTVEFIEVEEDEE